MPTCVHCGRMIDDLEAREWGQDRVCVHCHGLLTLGAGTNQSIPAGPPPMLGYAFPGNFPPLGNSGLGTTSLVLGIVSLLVAWIPFCGVIAWPVCLAGLILAIIDLCQKRQTHANAFAGLILALVGFVAPFICVIGTSFTASSVSTPSTLTPSSATTQSAPTPPPAPDPVEAPDVEK